MAPVGGERRAQLGSLLMVSTRRMEGNHRSSTCSQDTTGGRHPLRLFLFFLEVMRTLARQASPPPLPLLYSSHVILTPHQPEASARLHPHHQHLHATHSLLAFSTSAN